MAKKNWKVISKDKKRVVVERKDDGKQKTLLTPTGKVSKFKKELEHGIGITNDMKKKKTESGKDKKLTKAQKAYRRGYIQALGEQAAIYKKNKA